MHFDYETIRYILKNEYSFSVEIMIDIGQIAE